MCYMESYTQRALLQVKEARFPGPNKSGPCDAATQIPILQ